MMLYSALNIALLKVLRNRKIRRESVHRRIICLSMREPDDGMFLYECEPAAEDVPSERVAVCQMRLQPIAKVRRRANVLQPSLSAEGINPIPALYLFAQQALILFQCPAGDVLKMLTNQLTSL